MNKYNGYDDTTLVEMTLLGDNDAYGELVQRHEKAVMGAAVKITKNEFSAQDATQDAFVSAWMNLSALREKASFRPWVCAIAGRCALKVNERYAAAIPTISLDALDFDIPDAERCDEYDDIHDAVAKLSEKIRDVIQLHYFDGYSVSEIAERLSVPVGTVKWRLNEGRKKLREGFGIMEKEFDENEAMVRRVMRQVDELKLWRLKSNKTGFEEDYKNVLASANELPDGKNKSHAMADILILGYWWLPGQKNDQVLAEIKKHATASKNESVIESVIANECDIDSDDYDKQLLEKGIPLARSLGMKKAEAFCRFWLGWFMVGHGRTDEGFACYREVMELLKPTDVYYANAKAAITVEQKGLALKNKPGVGYHATGELLRFIDGKLYFIEQPGYSRGKHLPESAVFYYASRCDSMIYDPDLKAGDTVLSSDKTTVLLCEDTDAVFETPAGRFENCTLYSYKINGDNCKTAFCPGIGIVYSEHEDIKCELKKYEIKGGDGMIPFYPGNRWEYTLEDDAAIYETDNAYEVTAYENGTVTVSAYTVTYLDETKATFQAYMKRAATEYAAQNKDGTWLLNDVRGLLAEAEKLADTPRKKVWFASAYDVMDRILESDDTLNPDCKEVGIWNFFYSYDATVRDGKNLLFSGRDYSFEWKETTYWNAQSQKMLYNFLYDILNDAAGCVWNDKWTPGYAETCDVQKWNYVIHTTINVKDEETVRTPAGAFENCRHVCLDVSGVTGGLGYRGGKMEYWFAERIGVVKFSRPINEETENIWELTGYNGEGDGFFPINDGLMRRYEPKDIGSGCRGFVEYTYVNDEKGATVFCNACGVQSREEYEKSKKNS